VQLSTPPSIMAGQPDHHMMALSMVIIASMVGAGGL
jgi:ABC-type proline/glycine betaine transport system permease subunit